MSEKLRAAAERILMIARRHKSPLSYEERVTEIVRELERLCAERDELLRELVAELRKELEALRRDQP